MNIFVLDKNIKNCARYHADRHVVKMILEGTQMLCTVLNENGIVSPYKSTHIHHPCTLWAGRSLSNWTWLRRLAAALNREYRFRFDADDDHKSAVIARLLPEPPIRDIGLTEFAQAMPEAYREPGNPVEAYRRFYVMEKSAWAKWTKRRPPEWFTRALRGA